jgi:hypothetical protein
LTSTAHLAAMRAQVTHNLRRRVEAYGLELSNAQANPPGNGI